MKKDHPIFLLKRSPHTLFYFVLIITILSCSRRSYPIQNGQTFKSDSSKQDYSSLNYWASHPWKTDAADNIPLSIQNKNKDSLADVFFIHPTTYTDVAMSMGWNADIDNEALNKKTDDGQYYTRQVSLTNIAGFLHHVIARQI